MIYRLGGGTYVEDVEVDGEFVRSPSNLLRVRLTSPLLHLLTPVPVDLTTIQPKDVTKVLFQPLEQEKDHGTTRSTPQTSKSTTSI